MKNLDVQCLEVLKGLSELEEVLAQPLASKALALTDSAMMLSHHRQLVRLRKSLEQYAERQAALTYIGLVGHFSSGKSSLINAVLGLNADSGSARPTGLHPTDKWITLLTHGDNAEALVAGAGIGSMTIRIQTIASDFLKHLVLADSPGTGDPHLIEEMARDFLPMCDLVLFLFSAASPLDETDLPTLRELHKRLPFIPMLFVVTRADELRKDKVVQLSEDNFDRSKASEFLAEAISRISRILGNNQYSPSDFLLVDNVTGFGIEALKLELMRRADPFNPLSRMTIHGHKVHFYLTAARELSNVFAEFLDSKLSDLRAMVSLAERNIREYNRGVEISNNHLTKSWFDRYTALQDHRRKAHERPSDLPALTTVLNEMKLIAEAETKARQSLSFYSESAAESVAAHVRRTEFSQISNALDSARRDLKKRSTFDGLGAFDHGLGAIEIAWRLDTVGLIPSRDLARSSASVREATRDTIESGAGSARRFLNTLTTVLTERAVVDECHEVVKSAEASLDFDLGTYFKNVHVYRTGVFSMGSKEMIAKLGISEELSKRETEFTDEDKESLISQAKEALFPSVAATLAATTTRMRELCDRLPPIDVRLKSIRIDAPPSVLDQLSEPVTKSSQDLKSELTVALQRETDQLIDHAQTKISSILSVAIDNYDKAIAEASRRRLHTYGFTAGIISVMTAAITTTYGYLKHPVGQSVLAVVFWGVIAGLVANGIGFGIVWFRDNFPETKRRINETQLASLASQVDCAIKTITSDHSFSCLEKTSLSSRVSAAYSNTLSSLTKDGWQSEADLQFTALKEIYHELTSIRAEYLQAIEDLVVVFSGFFEDSEKNLGTLRSISQQIKDRAIQPSFDLLAQTSNELANLLSQIRRIEFI
jgi:predicted GTPase